jgi:hypothetical protein
MPPTTHETQPPVTDLEIQMLRLYYNALDKNRQQQLFDYTQQLLNYAQQLIDEHHGENPAKMTSWA